MGFTDPHRHNRLHCRATIEPSPYSCFLRSSSEQPELIINLSVNFADTQTEQTMCSLQSMLQNYSLKLSEIFQVFCIESMGFFMLQPTCLISVEWLTVVAFADH